MIKTSRNLVVLVAILILASCDDMKGTPDDNPYIDHDKFALIDVKIELIQNELNYIEDRISYCFDYVEQNPWSSLQYELDKIDSLQLLYGDFKGFMFQEITDALGSNHFSYEIKGPLTLYDLHVSPDAFENNTPNVLFANKDMELTERGENFNRILDIYSDVLFSIGRVEYDSIEFEERVFNHYSSFRSACKGLYGINKQQTMYLILDELYYGTQVLSNMVDMIIDRSGPNSRWNKWDTVEPKLFSYNNEISNTDTMSIDVVFSAYDSYEMPKVRFWLDDSTKNPNNMNEIDQSRINLVSLAKGRHTVYVQVVLDIKENGDWHKRWVDMAPYSFIVK